MATLLEQSNHSPAAQQRPTREQCIQEAGAVLAFWLSQGPTGSMVQADAA